MKIPIGPRALPFFLFPNPLEHFSFIFLFFPTFLQHKKASVGKRVVCAYSLSPTIKSWPFLLQCHFTLDIEAPIVKQCPGDIVREEETFEARVHWTNPVFSDNSGSIAFSSNRQIGELFAVPGTYQIVYTANDQSNNQNKNCSFRITLKSKIYSYLLNFKHCFTNCYTNNHIQTFSCKFSLFYLSSFSAISFMAHLIFLTQDMLSKRQFFC